ncbi:AFG2-interacting ribosome maturation factor [Centropristis striata]|uniref:AFG2-interacting ribosome maturation factor n=1 Tax=Centropristis striata TaxID=184440 RepID=UPI0027E1077A|nr:AFG2-interacting ribosome maturation factor [Centropristis striata]
MSKPALLPLHQALKKSFQSVENNQKVWRSVLADCSPLMVSLGNLAEQSRALSNVQISNTPLRDFPDLEEKLRFKLSLATDTVLGKLHDKMSSLQSVRDSISNQVSAVFQLYEQQADSLDLLAVTERSATAPSVSDMLEWLQDAERHYRQQFLRRKTLLQTLRPDDLSLLESAPKRWKSLESATAEDHITDTLCKVSFFIESQ